VLHAGQEFVMARTRACAVDVDLSQPTVELDQTSTSGMLHSAI
jgi:hypothetical protein